MSAPLHPTPQESRPVAFSSGGRVIQSIQGAYYILLGVCTVFAIRSGQPATASEVPVGAVWLARIIGLVVAAFGVALLYSGQRQAGPFISAMVAMAVSIVLFVLSTASIASGVLSMAYLVDSGLEFLFACWWAFAALFVAQMTPDTGQPY